jgi:hypothetical protein
MVTRPTFKINDAGAPGIGPFVTSRQLANRAGVSPRTIKELANGGEIPQPVKRDQHGNALFDLGDQVLAAWVEAVRPKR